MLVRFLANAAALALATWLLPGISLTDTKPQNQVLTILAVAVIFGVVNSIVKPLFKFAAAPLVLLSLGLFLMVINGLLLMLTSWLAGKLSLGWQVDGFWSAFWGALLVSVVSFVLNAFFSSKGEDNR
ncbi:MAG: phage holin family protein [Micropruina sp.]|nr:MAG: phage holin family protein [Micropruina sp.]